MKEKIILYCNTYLREDKEEKIILEQFLRLMKKKLQFILYLR